MTNREKNKILLLNPISTGVLENQNMLGGGVNLTGNRQKSPWKKVSGKKVLKFHTVKVLWKKVLLLKSLRK